VQRRDDSVGGSGGGRVSVYACVCVQMCVFVGDRKSAHESEKEKERRRKEGRERG